MHSAMFQANVSFIACKYARRLVLRTASGIPPASLCSSLVRQQFQAAQTPAESHAVFFLSRYGSPLGVIMNQSRTAWRMLHKNSCVELIRDSPGSVFAAENGFHPAARRQYFTLLRAERCIGTLKRSGGGGRHPLLPVTLSRSDHLRRSGMDSAISEVPKSREIVSEQTIGSERIAALYTPLSRSAKLCR